MNERGRIRFGNTTIDYEVRRSERRKKTVQITTDGGGVQIAAPMTTPDSELRAIVRKRASWILSHASAEMLEAAPKRFVSGETLPYLGRNVRMIVDVAGRLVHRDFCYAHDRDTTCSPTSFSVHEYDTANLPASSRLVGGACAQARARPRRPPRTIPERTSTPQTRRAPSRAAVLPRPALLAFPIQRNASGPAPQ